MIQFFLDEMYSQVIAAMARDNRIDIVSSHEIREQGADDRDVLHRAGAGNRCVITQNHRHFVPLTVEFFNQGLPHAGVLLIAGTVPSNAYAPIARAIVRFARENPDGLQPYEIRWLDVNFD